MAARAPEHVYVYYRVHHDSAAARRTIADVLAAVERATGVAGRLFARTDDSSTWMEVYAPVTRPAAFLRHLAAAERAHDATAIAVDGMRHVERFAALPRRAPRD